MFRDTELLGVSMVSQRNRRVLVVCVYVLFAALTLVGAVSNGRSLFGNTGLPFVLLVLLVTRYTFGRLVPNYTYDDEALQQVDTSMPEVYGITSEHPLVMKPAAEPEPDERDVAVRNAAYYACFRALAVYILIAWIEIVVVTDPRFHLQAVAPTIAVYTVFSAVVLVFTLPQALILWNEPDLLGEEN